MNELSPESELLRIVREIKELEHRRLMLQARDSANSRTLQAELAKRIAESEQRRSALGAQIQASRGEPS